MTRWVILNILMCFLIMTCTLISTEIITIISYEGHNIYEARQEYEIKFCIAFVCFGTLIIQNEHDFNSENSVLQNIKSYYVVTNKWLARIINFSF